MSERAPLYNLSESEKPPSEFGFHQKRFEKMAEEYNRRGMLQKIIDWRKGIGWKAEMRPIDFAHEEAIRDNADFERRNTAEFRAWEKYLRPVVEHLLQKRENPETKEIRTLLLILGGGMRGPYSAGQALGLNEMGLGKAFDTVVGISAGAGTAAYFTGGEESSRLGTSLFYEECTTKNFIDFRRVHQIMDVGFMGEKLRRGEKALDEEAIREARSELYVGVTRSDTMESELISVKTAKPNMAAAVEASMAMPILYRKAVEVNGGKYIDGAFDYMPVEKLVERFHPTDILILPNTPFDRMDAFQLSPGEYLFAELASRYGGSMGSIGTLEKLIRMKEQVRASLEFIQKQHGVNIGILWPPDSGLTNVTTDPDKIQAAVLESARGVVKAFGGEQPEEIELYHHKD